MEHNDKLGPCLGCSMPMVVGVPFFELLISSTSPSPSAGHQHNVCVECFGFLHAKRACHPSIACPFEGCQARVVGHVCHRQTQKETRQGWTLSPVLIPSSPVYIGSPSAVWDPVRHYNQQLNETKANNMVITVSWPSDMTTDYNCEDANSQQEEVETRTVSIEVPFKEQTERFSETVKEKLVSMMLLLHHVFLGGGKKGEDDAEARDLSSSQQLFHFALSDRSLVTRAIVALGSGRTVEKILPFGEESNVYCLSTFLAFWGATEMMRRATSKRSGVLQDYIANQLSVWRAPLAVVDLLCRFRISSSREKVRLKDIDTVNAKIVAGWKMKDKKWSIIMIAYDNLGFRILGAKAGYDQYTMMQVHEGSHSFLSKLGFYLPPDSEKAPISRTRLLWAEERENINKEDILPSDDDYKVFGNQVYSHIDVLMQVCNQIPSLDEARELLRGGDAFDLDARLSTTYGALNRFGAPERTVDVVQQEDEEPGEDPVEMVDPCLSKTMYDHGDQQVEIDLPLRADLNKKETVLGIVKGALNLRERALGADDGAAPTINTNERPLMEDLGVTIAGDGGPSYTFLTLRAGDPDGFKDIHNFSGGFHWDLNVKQRHGLRFGDSHLKYFLHPFRDTDKKKDWYLNPGDPGQTALEQPEMTDAHYIMAMRGLSKVKNGDPISAVDVDDWMLERAIEHDLCMTILMDLRFAEVSYLIRDSEREGKLGSLELFRVGAKLSVLLFARTHATKYVRIACEYWIWWHCSSAADKVLYKEFHFTKQTVNGSPIWVDRFVEWMNRDLREYLGKYAKPNQEMLLRRAALLLKERKQERAELATFFGGRSRNASDRQSDHKLAISVIFCHQMDLIGKLNLWSEGPVKVGKGAEVTFEEPQQFTDPSGEFPLNTESLFDVSGAEEAIMAYFEHSGLTGEVHQVSRSEKHVSLRMTPVLLSEVKQARADEITRRTSKDYKVLASISTKAYLISRLTDLLERFPFLSEDTGLQLPSASEKKDVFAEAVANAHEAIIEQNADFLQQVKETLNAQSRICDGFADKPQKRAELQRPFYALPQASKAPFFEKKYTINYAENVVVEEVHGGEEPPPLPPPLATPERAPPDGDLDSPFVQDQFSRMSLFSP